MLGQSHMWYCVPVNKCGTRSCLGPTCANTRIAFMLWRKLPPYLDILTSIILICYVYLYLCSKNNRRYVLVISYDVIEACITCDGRLLRGLVVYYTQISSAVL